jgi:hypothetical protein
MPNSYAAFWERGKSSQVKPRPLKNVPIHDMVTLHLDFAAKAPGDFPALIRSVLPEARSGDFVRWKLGQGVGSGGRLVVNSWARAFALRKIDFGGTNAAHSVMLGRSFCANRAAMFSPLGVKYAVVLPGDRADGGGGNDLKVCLIANESAGELIEGVVSSGLA